MPEDGIDEVHRSGVFENLVQLPHATKIILLPTLPYIHSGPFATVLLVAANYLAEMYVRSAFHRDSTLRRSASVSSKLICDITPHINLIEA
jgi:hypothetical protein